MARPTLSKRAVIIEGLNDVIDEQTQEMLDWHEEPIDPWETPEDIREASMHDLEHRQDALRRTLEEDEDFESIFDLDDPEFCRDPLTGGYAGLRSSREEGSCYEEGEPYGGLPI
jgi:hypothetical protein